ncbi:MAG: guanylate kinase [bacterium]
MNSPHQNKVEQILDAYSQPRKGSVFVVSGPSGVGKTAICKQTMERDSKISYSVSYTTRDKRPGEQEGKEYHFVSRDQFQKQIEEKGFWEYAQVHGNLYGTSRIASEKNCQAGYDLLMDLDVQGARQLRKLDIDAHFIFILPPSMEILRERLVKRRDTTEGEIEARMEEAYHEMALCQEYDYIIINRDLDKSVETFCNIVLACRAKNFKLKGKIND